MAAQPASTEPERRPEADQVQAVFREIEQLLATGFTGTIRLHCHKGGVPRYTIEETRTPAGGRG